MLWTTEDQHEVPGSSTVHVRIRKNSVFTCAGGSRHGGGSSVISAESLVISTVGESMRTSLSGSGSFSPSSPVDLNGEPPELDLSTPSTRGCNWGDLAPMSPMSICSSRSRSASASAFSLASLLLSSRCFIRTAMTTLTRTNWAVRTKETK